MDPNETLKRLRNILNTWDEWGILEADAEDALNNVTELFYALDDWLSQGGFRPDDWS